MHVEINDTTVIVHWGGVLVTLQMKSQVQAEALREHLGNYRSMQPYTVPNNSPSRMKEPGFLADVGRAYYGFLDP